MTNESDSKQKLKFLIDDLAVKLGKTHRIMKNVTKKAKAWKVGQKGEGDSKITSSMTGSGDASESD